jgi:hypothetical protein
MSNNENELKGLKKLDYTIVEAVGELVIRGGSIAIIFVSGIAALFAIPILVVAEVIKGNFNQVGQHLLFELAAIYLARGVLHFTKGIDEAKKND